MENNFYVNQEIVAIRNHSQGFFKKGDEFVIQGIKKSCCSISLDIGHKYDFDNYDGVIGCYDCGKDTPVTDGIMWYDNKSFAPKQQLSSTTFEDIQELIKYYEENTLF